MKEERGEEGQGQANPSYPKQEGACVCMYV
jgi:hypothetical protein